MPTPTIRTPNDLAQRLAQLARSLNYAITAVLTGDEPHGALHQQLAAFRETLLPTITPAEFADMYAQTIVYGLFAARVVAPDRPHLSRRDAAQAISANSPLIRALFQHIASDDLDEPVAWLVDDCAHLLQHTDMADVLQDFGTATRQNDPVVHFYETFLAAYDPRLRDMRGVYYTPEPVVSYIVRSVDAILHTRFGKPLGLADEHTLILDPATGTATFLHTVVQHIYDTLQRMGMASAWNQYVPTNLLPRLFGFELLMAPYTIAHLKLSMLVQNLGYTFGSNERLGVYLTNALSDASPEYLNRKERKERKDRTGDRTGSLNYSSISGIIAEDGHAADEVISMPNPGIISRKDAKTQRTDKEPNSLGDSSPEYGTKQSTPVMVVLGNPPYSYQSANTGEWISSLVRDYYQVDGQPLGERNPKGLQDDYVKFIRFGQWRINQTREGVLAFISNNGYLDNPTFRGMRQHLLQEFDAIYILNLHGNSRKKEQAPDGSPDENVFDIQQGVAIGIFVKMQEQHKPQMNTDDHRVPDENITSRKGAKTQRPDKGSDRLYDSSFEYGRAPDQPDNVADEGYAAVYYADMWGQRADKYEQLHTHDISTTDWQPLRPRSPWYLFVPQDTELADEYQCGWSIVDILPVYSAGIVTARDHLALHWSREDVQTVVYDFARLSEEEARQTYNLGNDTRDWKVALAQEDVHRHPMTDESVVPVYYRPFDQRYTWYSGQTRGFLCMPRPATVHHVLAGDNLCLTFTRSTSPGQPFEHVFCTSQSIVARFFTDAACTTYFAPLYLYPPSDDMFAETSRRANFSPAFIADIEHRLGVSFVADGRGDLHTTIGAEDIFHSIYAMLHRPTYRTRYAEFLKADFPRIPIIPSSGKDVDSRKDAKSAKTGQRPDSLSTCSPVFGITSDRAEFATLAASGAALVDLHLLRLPGSGGVGGAGGAAVLVNPGEQGVTQQNVTLAPVEYVYYDEQQQRVVIGEGMCFAGVEPATWAMQVGGYQPLHRWLKDRTGRTLSFNDALYYMRMVVALRETRRVVDCL